MASDERSATAVPAQDIRDAHSVAGRVCVVTGAGRGVGRGVALHLGKAGAAVVVADVRPDLVERTVEELAGLGVANLGVVCDVGQQHDIGSLVEATVEHFGRLDALVNNAQSFRPPAPLDAVTEQDVEVFHRTGVLGTLWAMQAVYPHMRDRGWGRIVNFASAMGVTGGPTFGAYNASKEGIRALTRTAAREWGAEGIVVNAIAPAAADHHGEAGRRSEAYREFMERCPMGRQGDPETDVGAVAHFLCTDACRFLTGHTFMVDGGAYLWA